MIPETEPDKWRTSRNAELSWLNGSLRHRTLDAAGHQTEGVGYHPNGKLMFRYLSVKNQLNGPCRLWYESGQIQQEEIYLNDQLHGTKRTWCSNGALESRVDYRRGLRHGSDMAWSEDKKLIRHIKYASGQLHGICVTWDHMGLDCRKVFVQGRPVSDEVEQTILSGQLTAQYILRLRNSAVRRLCLEELGYARFLSQIPHEVIATDGEQELVRINWHAREEPICLVKVRCPSTGAYYALRVPPETTTVKGAVAWTFGLDENNYKPIAET
jgi:hypothetical protein